LSFINQQQAEEILKWRKKHPKEAKEWDSRLKWVKRALRETEQRINDKNLSTEQREKALTKNISRRKTVKKRWGNSLKSATTCWRLDPWKAVFFVGEVL